MSAFEIVAVVVGSVIAYLLGGSVTAGLAARRWPDLYELEYGLWESPAPFFTFLLWPIAIFVVLFHRPAAFIPKIIYRLAKVERP